jgi:hypothetical protein
MDAINEDKLEKPRHILQGRHNPLLKLYLTFLSYILAVINKINLEFQSEATQLPFLYNRISTLYNFFFLWMLAM